MNLTDFLALARFLTNFTNFLKWCPKWEVKYCSVVLLLEFLLFT